MKHIIVKFTSAALMLAVAFGCGKDEFDKPDYYTRSASTEFGQMIVNGSEDYITHVKYDTQTKIMDGVSLLSMGYLNSSSHAMQMYIYRIELAPAMVQVCVPGDDMKFSTSEKLTAQAAAIENQGTYLVMGGISGSAFSADTGAPKGLLYHNGKAHTSKIGTDKAFFAIMKDGSAQCLEASEFDSRKDKITEGVSGSSMLLQNGYILAQTDADATARTAVGVDEGGNTVFLVAVDGGDFFYSNGISCDDLAKVLKGCGACNAMTLDKGDNVSAFQRNEDSLNLFEMINKPSNMGLEPSVGNGLVILQY